MTAPAGNGVIDEVIETVRRTHVPDFRSGVFDVQASRRGGTLVLTGQSTHPDAVRELMQQLVSRGILPVDKVVRLPDPGLGEHRHALVRAPVAPLYAEPRLPAPQISQLILGMRVEVLSRRHDWVRLRGEDGYVGWVHGGYLRTGSEDWAYSWERGTAGVSAVSLGAELVDDEGRTLAPLPWGARLAHHTRAYHLPDGRHGLIANGEVVPIDRLRDWFPPRGESVVCTARRWLGAPYLWGGLTQLGVDCSGFVQAVLWMHGIALPRDSDLQSAMGARIEQQDPLAAARPGDLVYFAERAERVSHVAISLGGALIIHSALGNGGVAIDDLNSTASLPRRLRDMVVSARRMLPD